MHRCLDGIEDGSLGYQHDPKDGCYAGLSSDRRLWKLILRIVYHCIDVIFFRPKGHSVINKYLVLPKMESIYHIVAIRVNETSWAHVWRLRFCYLETGYDMDQLIKVAHFIPVKTTYSRPQLAELYMSRIVCLHGVPKKIVSDRGTQFTSRFWERLREALDTQLRFSSAYHP
jgi:hypothetical protein